jgi:hypothetical protein
MDANNIVNLKNANGGRNIKTPQSSGPKVDQSKPTRLSLKMLSANNKQKALDVKKKTNPII